MLWKNARCGFASPIIGGHLRFSTLGQSDAGAFNKITLSRLCKQPANALIGAVVAFLSGTVAQVTFLPKRDSRHFVLRISSSMARRVADYARDGDAVRARAMA